MPVIAEKLKPYPKLNYSLLPTPVHRLDYLSHKCGVNVYCKRDDLTGIVNSWQEEGQKAFTSWQESVQKVMDAQMQWLKMWAPDPDQKK